jgi:hypothetical protein
MGMVGYLLNKNEWKNGDNDEYIKVSFQKTNNSSS